MCKKGTGALGACTFFLPVIKGLPFRLVRSLSTTSNKKVKRFFFRYMSIALDGKDGGRKGAIERVIARRMAWIGGMTCARGHLCECYTGRRFSWHRLLRRQQLGAG